MFFSRKVLFFIQIWASAANPYFIKLKDSLAASFFVAVPETLHLNNMDHVFKFGELSLDLPITEQLP